MKKRFSLLLLLVTFLIFAASGCGKSGSDAALQTETIPESVQSQETAPPAKPSAGNTGASSPARDYTGQTMSILGDSISTFDGYIPTDYNIFYPGSGEIHQVESTWWYQVLERTGLRLCSNASSSNTTITGDSTDTSGSAPGCSTRRINDLKGQDGSHPDVIIVFMGVNDFLKSVDLGTFSQPSPREEGENAVFSDAFEIMIQKLKATFPTSAIYCCTLLETDAGDIKDPPSYPSTNINNNVIADYNAEIAAIATAYGVTVIDVYQCGITYDTLKDYTGDGVHPNPAGAKLIANYVTEALLH